MEILQTKEECDHVQFLITEKNTTGQRQNDQTAEVETLSQGRHIVMRIEYANRFFFFFYFMFRTLKNYNLFDPNNEKKI